MRRKALLAASTRIGPAICIAAVFALGGAAGCMLKPSAIETKIVMVEAPPPPAVPESPPASVPVAVLSPHEDGFAALMKASGETDLVMRLPDAGKTGVFQIPPLVGGHNGELPFSSWAQLMMDDFNRNQSGMIVGMKGRYDVFVRDYGLLITKAEMAPKDAITLTEFVRQVHAQKEKEKVPAPR